MTNATSSANDKPTKSENDSSGGRVLKNAFFGIASEGIGGILNFVIIIIIARALGANDFGHFSFVLAFVGVFQLLADFGVTNVVVREIARDKDRGHIIMGNVKPITWLFSIAIFALIGSIGYLVTDETELFHSILIMGFAVLVTFHGVLYGSVCRAYEQMQYNAIAFVGHKIILLITSSIALLIDTGIIGLAVAYLISNLCQFSYFYLTVKRKFFTFRWHFDFSYWRYLLLEAIPVGMSMIFRRATLHADTLVLTSLASATAVGLFNSAYRVVQMVDMIPFTLAIPLYPPLSRLAQGEREPLMAFFQTSLKIFLVLAWPLCLVVGINANVIVTSFFGAEYQTATPVLQIITFSLLFLFPTALMIYFFSAIGKQKFHFAASGICLGVNLLIDLITIPWLGALGAAIGTLVAEACFLTACLWFLNSLNYRISLLQLGWRPALAALTACLLFTWKMPTNIMELIGLSILYGICYLPIVILIGTFNRAEWQGLRQAVQGARKGNSQN